MVGLWGPSRHTSVSPVLTHWRYHRFSISVLDLRNGVIKNMWHTVGLGCCWLINSSPPNSSPPYMHKWTGSPLDRVMACRLFSTKPLPEPMLSYCHLDSREQISVKIESVFYSVSEKLSWLIRHLSDGLYIFYINLWNFPSDIWAYPSDMSGMSDVFRLHCSIIFIQESAYEIVVSLSGGHFVQEEMS